MTRTRYALILAISLLAEAALWGAFGALAWTAVLDAEAFVGLVAHAHFALAVLVAFGVLAFVAGATLAIPELHDMRRIARRERACAVAQADAKRRLELLAQSDIPHDVTPNTCGELIQRIERGELVRLDPVKAPVRRIRPRRAR